MEDHSSKAKKTKFGYGQYVELPPEIVELILLALPAKPLCRLKLVCKPWQSLISHTDFIVNHSKATVAKKDRRRFFINYKPLPPKQIKLYSLNLNEYDHNKNDVTTIEASDELCSWGPYVHASCNGILLMTLFAKDVWYRCLMNPLTKEVKKLPRIPNWRKPMMYWILRAWSLEFDQSSNDYKVTNGRQYQDGLLFSVYTLKNNSWRKVDNLFPYNIYMRFDAIMVNGHAHWLARKIGDGDKSLVIICFVSAKEKVREIALPGASPTSYMQLGTFRDCLCLTLVSDNIDNYKFWVMKEYGVCKSWTEMRVSEPYMTLSHSGFRTETHDLMMFDERFLVMYDFSNGEFRSWPNQIDGVCSVGSYVETLATLTNGSRPTSLASSPKKDEVSVVTHIGQMTEMKMMMTLSSTQGFLWMHHLYQR